jgi:hypothetical protein
MNNEFVNKLVQALVHSVLSILKFIFLTPLNLWLKAVERLSAQKAAGTLEMANIHSEWPLLSYVKRFNLDFLFDAIAFLAYPLGLLYSVYVGFDMGALAAHINEIALEFIGDVVLEQNGTDYVFIEDYIDDIGILF